MIRVVVNDAMQPGYEYYRTEPAGRNFSPNFAPELTPKEMLQLGVFGGKYMTDCRDEFPASWFAARKTLRAAARSPHSTILASMRRSRCASGNEKAGFIRKIHAGGRRRQRQAILHWAYDSRKI